MDSQKGFLNQSLLGELEYHLIVGILECFGFLAVSVGLADSAGIGLIERDGIAK